MLPLIQKEVVTHKGWVSNDEMLDCFALSQVTPGVMAVNAATFVGYKRGGVLGALCATAGVILPSLFIIVLIASVLDTWADNPLVAHAFVGIRVAVGALILDASIKLMKGVLKNFVSICICAGALIMSAVFKTSPVPVVIAAALSGLLLLRAPQKKEAEK